MCALRMRVLRTSVIHGTLSANPMTSAPIISTAVYVQSPNLRACHCCGLIQQIPTIDGSEQAFCQRCDSKFARGVDQTWTIASAMAALILYPVAMSVPVLTIERFGAKSETDIWHGAVGLVTSGHYVVGIIVLVCSIIVPLLKLIGLLGLSLTETRKQSRLRARTYRLIDAVGRWGMVDVMLVAGVVAAVKLGDLVTVDAGPGAAIFAAMVLCSLLAGATFDPRAMWRDRNE